MNKFATRLAILLVAGVPAYLLWFGVPGSAPEVRVECFGDGAAVNCSVEHVAGRSRADACWDVVFTCSNGTTASAHRCDSVEHGGKSVRRILFTDFSNAEACNPTGSKIQNLVVTAR